MKVKIVAPGKVKEKFYVQAIAEYSKRLSKYCNLSIVEVADEKTPEGASKHEEELIKNKEGDRILSHISDSEFVIALAIKGDMLDSVEHAKKISSLTLSGTSQITYVIGGSLGLSDQVMKRADMSLSFSKMTFPHQLMRVILLEQIYRAFRIINNEPYHK